MPLAADRADRLRRIHPKQRRWNRSSNIALWPLQGFAGWHRRLSESEGECDTASFVELGRLKQDLKENLIGEVVDVHLGIGYQKVFENERRRSDQSGRRRRASEMLE
jgi:hypothetical protein